MAVEVAEADTLVSVQAQGSMVQVEMAEVEDKDTEEVAEVEEETQWLEETEVKGPKE